MSDDTLVHLARRLARCDHAVRRSEMAVKMAQADLKKRRVALRAAHLAVVMAATGGPFEGVA